MLCFCVRNLRHEKRFLQTTFFLHVIYKFFFFHAIFATATIVIAARNVQNFLPQINERGKCFVYFFVAIKHKIEIFISFFAFLCMTLILLSRSYILATCACLLLGKHYEELKYACPFTRFLSLFLERELNK